MASRCGRLRAPLFCGQLYLADVAASCQPESTSAGTFSVRMAPLCCAFRSGERGLPGLWPGLALALHRGERHCWTPASSPGCLCRDCALDAPSPFMAVGLPRGIAEV